MAGSSSSFLSALSLILLLISLSRINYAWEGGVWDNDETNHGNPWGYTDPFEGVYLGDYGSNGKQVVRLSRKYGSWNNQGDSFEYVEAVKVNGDKHVPAGQVTFRAKLGRNTTQPGMWPCPQQLGAGASGSYIGQGRIADAGFRNPRWVEGVLFQLNGKLKGADFDLGFLFIIPNLNNDLILYKRLN